MDSRDAPDSLVALRVARASGRIVAAPDGAMWRVFELVAAYDRRGPSLVFETEGVMRRVRIYPSDWRTLSDRDLLALSENA